MLTDRPQVTVTTRHVTLSSLVIASLFWVTRLSALPLHQPAPPVEALTLLAGGAYQAKGVEVVYFWATWCAPCRESTSLLTKLSVAHSNSLSVRAISTEERAPLDAYLSERPSPLPFPYYHLGQGEGAAPHAYAREVSFLPFAFVIAKGELIWKGNPTYPKGEFERVLTTLLTKGERPQAPSAEVERLKAELKGLASGGPRSLLKAPRSVYGALRSAGGAARHPRGERSEEGDRGWWPAPSCASALYRR